MLVDLALVARLERTFADALADQARAVGRLHPGLGALSEHLGSGRVVLFGPGMWVNRAVALGLGDRAVTAGELDHLDEVFEAAGLSAEVDVCPWAHDSLLAGCAGRGFTASWFRSMLVRRIDLADANQPAGSISVRQPHDIAEWQNVSAVGFGYADTQLRRANDVVAAAAANAGDMLLVADLDGVSVGSAALGVRDGIAFLFGMSTLADARRRGVQSVLIHTRLAKALEAGCDLAVSTATPGSASERNLIRLGFDVIYTKLGLRRPS